MVWRVTRHTPHYEGLTVTRTSELHETVPYATYANALREADKELAAERDRRYAEVNVEKEKALKIKETADRDALDLARERQREKDAQSDALRDKTLSQSGIYATNVDLAAAIDALKTSQETAIHELVGKLQPFIDLVTQQQGAHKNSDGTWTKALGVLGVLIAFYVASKNGVKL